MHNLARWEDHPMSDEVPLAPVVRESEGSSTLCPDNNKPVNLPDTDDHLQEVGLTGRTDLKNAASCGLLTRVQDGSSVATRKVLCSMQVLPLLAEESIIRAELAQNMVPHHGLWPGFSVEAHKCGKDIKQILPPIAHHKSSIVVRRPGRPRRPVTSIFEWRSQSRLSW
eukprot:4733873-Prorocentrum_lima.AAC.1